MATTMPDSATRVLARFTAAPSMTTEKYDESIKRLKASGAQWPPDGLDYHVCFGTDGSLNVSEIWDSREQWEAFGERLMPVLSDTGIEFSSEPEVFDIHSITRR